MKEYIKLFALFIVIFIFYSCGEQGKVVDINEDKYYLNENDFWEPTNGPFSTQILEMFLNSNDHVYITCVDPLVSGKHIMKSIDNGKSWELLTDRFADSLKEVYLDPKCNLVVYNGLSRIYLRSTNDGQTWLKIADSIPGTDTITYIKTDSKGIIYATAKKQKSTVKTMFRSKDYGLSWEVLIDSLRVDIKDRILIDQNDVTYIFYTINFSNGYLKRSTDHGETWTLKEIASGYLDFTIGYDNNLYIYYRAISTDMGETWKDFGTKGKYYEHFFNLFASQKQNIYLTSLNCIYKSTDQGETWERILNSRNVQSIIVDSEGYLYALMYNSMIYKSKKPVE